MAGVDFPEIPPYVPSYFGPKYFGYFAPTNWGSGKSRREYPEIHTIFPPQLELFVLGHFAACPTIASVGSQFLSQMSWVVNRYQTCNEGTRHLLLPVAENLNPQLLAQMAAPVARLPEEPVGYYDRGFVPEIHLQQITPMGTEVGYGAIRLTYLLTRGITDLDEIKRSKEFMLAINRCVGEAGQRAELLVNLALAAIGVTDVDKYSALEHAIPPGKLREENNRRMYAAVVLEFVRQASWVIHFVNNLPASDPDQAEFKKLFYELLQLI